MGNCFHPRLCPHYIDLDCISHADGDPMTPVAQIFAMCLASMSNYSDLEKCVHAGVIEGGGRWSCHQFPDQPGKACTDEYWEFEKLYNQSLFNAAKKAWSKP
jgi:hypothetical protein